MNQEVENITGEQSRSKEKLNATILFVDDEKNILSSLNRLFRPIIEKVLTAESGVAGLEILNTEPVDIVISDMKMPEMDGAQFLEQVAEKYPNTIRILLTGYADITSTINAINKGSIYRYISKPWEDNDIRLTVQHALKGKFLEQERQRLQKLTESQNEELTELNQTLEKKVEQRTAQLSQAMSKLETTHNSLKKSYISSVKVFSNLIELREGSISGRSRIVAEQAKQISSKMGMDAEESQNVLIAGLLHDIGMIGLTDDIINKPYSAMTSTEKSKFQRHPVIGEGALMALEPLHEAARLIRSHHEQYDGCGYPDRLKGEEIPLGARIIALVSDYNSLVNGTLSKELLTTKQIFDYIKFNKKKKYDPVVVEHFLQLLEQEELAAKDEFITVMASGLEESMVLAKDIVNKDGLLLLANGHHLTENLIERICRFESSLGEDIIVYVRPN